MPDGRRESEPEMTRDPADTTAASTTDGSASAADAATASVIAALRAAGVDATARVLPESTRTAAHAAEALGCEVAAIANSLVFMADDSPLLVMTSGGHRVDPEALAARLGRNVIRKATAKEVKAATSQSIGGVSPVGHPSRIETVVDPALRAFDVIWAAAGTANSVFATTFPQLVAATDGTVVAVD